MDILTYNESLSDDNSTSYYDEGDESDDESDDEYLAELAKELIINASKQQQDRKGIDQNMMTADTVANLLHQVRINNSLEVKSDEGSKNGITVQRIDSSSSLTNTTDIKDDNIKTHPQQVLEEILSMNGYTKNSIPFSQVPSDFFMEMTDDNIKAYTNELITAVRNEDLVVLEQFLSEGRNLQGCNKFGESIISRACRNRCTKIVNFFLNKAQLSTKVCDDYGRTILHDACWVSDPDFDLIQIILEKCSDLFLICDKRGHTPLNYAQKDDFEKWCSFLYKNKDKIHPTVLGGTSTTCQ